jgi:uncharacterized protein (DUF58 family)
MVDISASSLFGTTKQTKRDLITEVCAVLAFSAITNNDKVGVVFFSDKIERYIAPKKGKSHILFIIRELLTMEPHSNAQTNINEALRFLNNVLKKRSIVFLLSDFISPPYKDGLTIACKRHDLIGIHVSDKRDAEFPSVGLVQVHDAEAGTKKWIQTSDPKFQKMYKEQFEKKAKEIQLNLLKTGAASVAIRTDEDYVKKLQLFFKARR